MPTDDERREVARRLRGIKYTREGCGHDMCCDLWSAIFDSDYRCTDLCDECEVAVLNSLADLIEPSCDREALLEQAKELEKCAWYFGLDFDAYEPLRYRLKEASEDFAGCARRIREACGEVVE